MIGVGSITRGPSEVTKVERAREEWLPYRRNLKCGRKGRVVSATSRQKPAYGQIAQKSEGVGYGDRKKRAIGYSRVREEISCTVVRNLVGREGGFERRSCVARGTRSTRDRHKD